MSLAGFEILQVMLFMKLFLNVSSVVGPQWRHSLRHFGGFPKVAYQRVGVGTKWRGDEATRRRGDETTGRGDEAMETAGGRRGRRVGWEPTKRRDDGATSQNWRGLKKA
jgi:hypothetical protein